MIAKKISLAEASKYANVSNVFVHVSRFAEDEIKTAKSVCSCLNLISIDQ